MENPIDRWAEYVICQKRGHEPSHRMLTTESPKRICKWCGTTYQFSKQLHESNAPKDPSVS